MRSPAAAFHLSLLWADAVVRAPATGEWQATGSEQDAHSLEPASVPPGSCGASPDHPWVAVDLQALRSDGSLLDLTSQSNPDGAARAFWNQRDGTFSWAFSGAAPCAGPPDWRGVDGPGRFGARPPQAHNQTP